MQPIRQLAPADPWTEGLLPQLKASAWLLSSMATARVALFMAFFVLLKRMGNEQFGIFFLGYSALTILPTVADLGMGQTFVRHIAFYSKMQPAFARYLHWLFALVKLGSVAAILAISWPAARVAGTFLRLQNQRVPLAIAMFGSVTIVLYDYVNSVFQAEGLFRRYEILLLLRNGLFLTTVVTLAALKSPYLRPEILLACMAGASLVLVGISMPQVSRYWRDRRGALPEIRSALFRYSKWLTVGALCFAVYRRVDVYFLSHFRSLPEVGIYSTGVVLAEPLAMFSPALFTVFYPRVSADPSAANLRQYLKIIPWVFAFAVSVGLMYAIGLRAAMPWLRKEYREAVPVTYLLLLGSSLLIAYNMLCVVFLASDRPEMFGKIMLTMALFTLIADWFAVPAYGTVGAASVYTACQFLGIALAVTSVRKMLRQVSIAEQAVLFETPVGKRITEELKALLAHGETSDYEPFADPTPLTASASRSLSSESTA